jgi:hypothetical protein
MSDLLWTVLCALGSFELAVSVAVPVGKLSPLSSVKTRVVVISSGVVVDSVAVFPGFRVVVTSGGMVEESDEGTRSVVFDSSSVSVVLDSVDVVLPMSPSSGCPGS